MSYSAVWCTPTPVASTFPSVARSVAPVRASRICWPPWRNCVHTPDRHSYPAGVPPLYWKASGQLVGLPK